jgi:hypothetical protein
METDALDDPIAFFAGLGGLRDLRLNAITLDIDEQILCLLVDDLYSSLEGTPDYPGERPCAVIFTGVTALRIDGDIDEGMRIGALRVLENDGNGKPFRLEVDLNIGSLSKAGKNITAQFADIDIEDIED